MTTMLDEHPQNLISDLLQDSNGSLHIRQSNNNNSQLDLLNNIEGDEFVAAVVADDAAVDEIKDEDKSKTEKLVNAMASDSNNDNKDHHIRNNDIVLYAGCKSLLHILDNPPASNDCDKGENQTNKSYNKNKDDISDNQEKNLVTDLVYVCNLYDPLMKAIREMLKMREAKPSKREREKNEKNKEEEEGDDEKEKDDDDYDEKEKDDDDYDNNNVNEEENDDKWTTVGNTSKPSTQEYEQHKYTASYLTQATFNSFNKLIPILLKMIEHPDRCNYDLQVKGPRIRQREIVEEPKVELPNDIMHVQGKRRNLRRAQCYLIFDKIYSIASIKAFESLKREVDLLLSLIYPRPTLSHYVDHEGDPKIRFVWGTCRSSDEIIQNTFVLRQGICSKGHESEENSHDDGRLMCDIEQFCKKVDDELLQPLAEYSNGIIAAQDILVEHLYDEIYHILSRQFSNIQLTVYGSCLSGLALGTSSDVDLSLSLTEIQDLKFDLETKGIKIKNYERQIKDYVFKVSRALSRFGRGAFLDVNPIPHARVPVVKGTCDFKLTRSRLDDTINFDICFHNDIAVANSTLLRNYSMIDHRVKTMMLSVKSWIKLHRVGNAADRTMSSYAWMILVVFYLQCIEFVPNLQCPKFMEAHGFYYDENSRLHNIDALRTHFLTVSQIDKVGKWKVPDKFAETPVSVLLAGFFFFYARHFPKHTTAVSIRLGKCCLQKTVFKKSCRFWRLCIEDPFETHDSHFPHDLGTPIDESGQARITLALTETADLMETMFSECNNMVDFIGSSQHLSSNHANQDMKLSSQKNLDEKRSRRNKIYKQIKDDSHQKLNQNRKAKKANFSNDEVDQRKKKNEANGPQQNTQQVANNHHDNKSPKKRNSRRNKIEQKGRSALEKESHGSMNNGNNVQTKKNHQNARAPEKDNPEHRTNTNEATSSAPTKKNQQNARASEKANPEHTINCMEAVYKSKNSNQQNARANETSNPEHRNGCNETTNNGEAKPISRRQQRSIDFLKKKRMQKRNQRKKSQQSGKFQASNEAQENSNKYPEKANQYNETKT